MEDEGKRQKVCKKTKGCDPKPNEKDPGKTDCICMHGTAEFRVDSKCKLVLDITPNKYGTKSTGAKKDTTLKTAPTTEKECKEKAKTDNTCKWQNNECKYATASSPVAGTDEFDIYTGELFIEFKPPVDYTENQLEQYMDVNCTCDGLPPKHYVNAISKCLEEINSWCKQHDRDREASCKAWQKKIL